MKFLLPLIALFMFIPIVSLAHGGFQKDAGNVIVYIDQSPVSPLVGEKVSVSFLFAKVSPPHERLPQLKVHLKLVDTFEGDELKDTVILEKDMVTDVNGALSFEYTFKKQNYFDLELSFVDPSTGENQETGFLIEPREVPIASASRREIFIFGGIGFILGIGCLFLMRKKVS